MTRYLNLIPDHCSHFSLGALTFVCFHGQNRPRDAEALKSVGLVLTTYATLAADSAGQRTLYQMEWYRIVLDEGMHFS